jgi:hypothetical protein
LFAEHNGFSTARADFYCSTPRVATFFKLTSLEFATLSVWRDHRIARGCHTIPLQRLLRRRWKMWGRVGGDRNTWSGWWWNTWRRKGAETYGRGCPAGGPRCVETIAPGTYFSSLRAMFDAISVWSSSSVSCDEGLRAVWSWRNPKLRLRGSHPWVRMEGTISHARVVVSHDLRCGMSLRGNRRGANPVVEEPALTWLVGDEVAAGSCSDVGRRCCRQLCPFPLQLTVQVWEQCCAMAKWLQAICCCDHVDQNVACSNHVGVNNRGGGGGIDGAYTTPASLIVHLWIYTAQGSCLRNTTDSQPHTLISIVQLPT